jgi:uncharacterized membrane protein
LLTLALTVRPATLGVLGKGPESKKLLLAIQSRLSRFAWISMAGLAITGMLMARRSPAFNGILSFANPYATVLSIKHILVLVMIVLSLYRSLALVRTKGPANPRREDLKKVLLLANLLLGVAVLLLSGFSSALAASALG